jgi:hypothetical protein
LEKVTKNVLFHSNEWKQGVFLFSGRDEKLTFEKAHDTFIRYHIENKTGERRGRLKRGMGMVNSWLRRTRTGYGQTKILQRVEPRNVPSCIGYHFISFGYDNVEQRPELCITLLRMVLGQYQPSQTPIMRALLAEKEIFQLAIRLAQSIRPKDVEHHFEVDHKTAVLMLQKLCAKGWLLPSYRVSVK